VKHDLSRFKPKPPRRKKDPDGTEYLWSPSADRYIACASGPESPEMVAKREKRARRKAEAFVMIPLWWAARAGEDGRLAEFLVCVDLVYRAWRANGNNFVLPNRAGVDPKVKYRVLRALEKAELVAVEWRRGKSPIITAGMHLAQMG
jgi:hypothetical protein